MTYLTIPHLALLKYIYIHTHARMFIYRLFIYVLCIEINNQSSLFIRLDISHRGFFMIKHHVINFRNKIRFIPI